MAKERAQNEIKTLLPLKDIELSASKKVRNLAIREPDLVGMYFNMCIFFVLFSYLSTFLGKSNVNANATFDLNDIFSTGKHKTSYGRKQEYQEDYNFAGW